MLSTAADCPVRPIVRRTEPGCCTTSCPSTVAVPPSGDTRVDRMLMSVVLPAPFGPSRAKIVPRSTVRSSDASTGVPANDLRRPRTSIAGGCGCRVMVSIPILMWMT
jgi:hypothetical protein